MADNENKIEQFCSFTTVTREEAVRCLEECQWDIERALNTFFQSEECKRDSDLARELEDGSQEKDSRPEQNRYLKLISWNIDGLDDKDTLHRTLNVCHTINKEKPSIVFLQEVIMETLILIENQCKDYHVIWHSETVYFCAIMVLKTCANFLSDKQVITFSNSHMGRFLLLQQVSICGTPFCLMTTHLESTKECSRKRKSQLKQCFDFISENQTDQIFLFGGDLNLRDSEVTDIGGLPINLQDTWELAGCPEETKYTWDMAKNDNLKLPWKPRCRFDRIYVKSSSSKKMIHKTFSFVGCERLASCGRFPSDHWGLLLEFDLE